MLPMRWPSAPGIKVTSKWQLAPGGRLLQLFVWVNSAVVTPKNVPAAPDPTVPDNDGGEKFTVVVPWFVTVTDCGELTVPSAWLGKLTAAGANASRVPPPVSATA